MNILHLRAETDENSIRIYRGGHPDPILVQNAQKKVVLQVSGAG